ncbi:pre-mRNA-splicing factor CWC25 homolog [Neolamprologus brichardi]|uniref:pre-mRNA-splicing factor CWC25 homolog n=1 Tax=Neolamprologus brichardi TaxID=32507 RepID=UPI001643A174|nr:pre-mRNA-splicing factor CWC25 homolog [Neolamprologus brichardi]
MGGGDLNLKKSWHPQTMKNIERVWKAEQKHEAERKKIEELQKQLKEERAREEMTKYAEETGVLKKKDDRLDWMYQGPAGQVSRDEYLLGRPIDKQITDQYEEPESGPSAETGLLPGSIFNPATPASSLDLAAKIREDPLFEIRKREEAKKREVLTNPVKMKKIKEMLRQNLDKKDKKKKRKNVLLIFGLFPQLPTDRYQQTSTSSGHSGRRERSRSRSPHRNYKDSRSYSSSSSHRSEKKQEPRAPSPQKDRYQRQRNHVPKKLSAEEMERKRREMMDQAKQREEDRENNVKRYKRQDEQEKQREQNAKHDRHAGFIHNMKLESAASSSLEDRVKRNIHSIQRTPASLENFMKR